MIGFHGIGNSHMFEDEEMGNYHPEIENGDSNGDNETGIIGALGNKLEKTFKNSLSAMKSEHAEKVHSNAAVADEEVSMQGKILANLMGHITNDLAIGKKIKSGHFRDTTIGCQTIYFFRKNSSLITFGFNPLTNNVLWCDELNFQLITSVTYGHMNMSLSLFRLTSDRQFPD